MANDYGLYHYVRRNNKKLANGDKVYITDTDGNLVLESKEKVFKAADGNGGIFNALSKNGITNPARPMRIRGFLPTPEIT